MDSESLANMAFEWIKSNQMSINECIQQTLPATDRNTTVKSLINLGKQRDRNVTGGLAFGVGQLKSKLMKDCNMSTAQANAAVSELKSDERIYQVGRGLGKMVAVFNGVPKATNDAVITPPTGFVPAGTTTHTFGQGVWGQTQTQGFNPQSWTFKAVTAEPVPEPITAEKKTLTPRLEAWLTTAKPMRKTVKKKNPMFSMPNKTVELENPAVVDYGDLQEIYDEIVEFNAKIMARLKAKCDEIKEENMVLNQSTWQS